MPPKESELDAVRNLDIHEDDELDKDQLVAWVEQASNLPAWPAVLDPPPRLPVEGMSRVL